MTLKTGFRLVQNYSTGFGLVQLMFNTVLLRHAVFILNYREFYSLLLTKIDKTITLPKAHIGECHVLASYTTPWFPMALNAWTLLRSGLPSRSTHVWKVGTFISGNNDNVGFLSCVASHGKKGLPGIRMALENLHFKNRSTFVVSKSLSGRTPEVRCITWRWLATGRRGIVRWKWC